MQNIAAVTVANVEVAAEVLGISALSLLLALRPGALDEFGVSDI